jgi:O-antigen/teichoic acid export membrane protein
MSGQGGTTTSTAPPKAQGNERRGMEQRVLYNTASNYAAQIVTIGLGLLLTPFLLHSLGPSAYGLWVLVSSVAGYGALLDFGIASAVVKYTSEYQARREQTQADSLVATAVSLYLLLGLAAMLLGLILAPIFPHLFSVPPGSEATASALVLLAGINVGVAIPSAATTAILRGLHRFDLANLIGIAGTLLNALLTVVVVLAGGELIGMMIVAIFVTAVMQIPSILLIRRVAPELRLHWRAADRRQLRTVAGFSSSTFITNLAGQLKTKTDEIVIGLFLPLAAVTPYALANRLSETAQIFAQQFIKVLLPIASMYDATDARARLRALYVLSTRLTLAIFVPFACVLVVLAQPLLTLWVGAAYANSTVLVLILTLARLFDISQWPAASVLTGMARHRPLAFISIGSGVVNLVLSLLLVQRYGVIGVALGTLIPATLETLLLKLPLARRAIGVSWREVAAQMFWPALGPAAPALLVLLALRSLLAPATLPAVTAVGVAGLGVYAAGYLLFGATADERRLYGSVTATTLGSLQHGLQQVRQRYGRESER